MPVIFPPVEQASDDGLLAVGADTRAEILEVAYRSGIFPWPISDDSPLTWFAPNPRGLIFTDEFHVSKSMKKFLKKTNYQITFNERFSEVVENCAYAKRKGEKGTWITDQILSGYQQLFEEEKAYSIEITSEGKLVGGLYGVCIGEIFSGESMFHKEPNASKLALITIMKILKKANIPFLDTQMVTPTIESFGGREISRDQYMVQLKELDTTISRSRIFSLELN